MVFKNDLKNEIVYYFNLFINYLNPISRFFIVLLLCLFFMYNSENTLAKIFIDTCIIYFFVSSIIQIYKDKQKLKEKK